MQQIKAEIKIIGINPYVSLPDDVLEEIFKEAGKDKGPIPIKGHINDQPYVQNLMKFRGFWRLYINTTMLKNSPKRIGEVITLTVAFDPIKRIVLPHPKWSKALEENPEAQNVFLALRPSLQLEIVRYISTLKTAESVDKNVIKAIAFLLGKGKFVGRDHV